MTVITPVDFVSAVQALIPTSGAWVQGYDAKDVSGKSVSFETPTATRFSLYGALKRINFTHHADSAKERHSFVLVVKQINIEIKKIHSKASIKNYNDRPSTTYANVMTILSNTKTSLGG